MEKVSNELGLNFHFAGGYREEKNVKKGTQMVQ